MKTMVTKMKQVTIYTDGACSGNPGPGGYGVILQFGEKTKEMSGGQPETTNNRMELMAAIIGLSSLKEPCEVTLYSDSQYLINGLELGWAKKWQANNWMRNKHEEAKNADLWQQLLDLIEIHKVKLCWVRGHDGHPENERCDRLATDYIKNNR